MSDMSPNDPFRHTPGPWNNSWERQNWLRYGSLDPPSGPQQPSSAGGCGGRVALLGCLVVGVLFLVGVVVTLIAGVAGFGPPLVDEDDLTAPPVTWEGTYQCGEEALNMRMKAWVRSGDPGSPEGAALDIEFEYWSDGSAGPDDVAVGAEVDASGTLLGDRIDFEAEPTRADPALVPASGSAISTESAGVVRLEGTVASQSCSTFSLVLVE